MIATKQPLHALLIALIAALPFRQGLAASVADSLCPETVSVQQTGVRPPTGWSLSYSTTPNQLERVTFYSGPPKDEASLVYDAWVNAEDSSTDLEVAEGPAWVLDQVLVSRHHAGAFEDIVGDRIVLPRDVRSSDKFIGRVAGDQTNRLPVDAAVPSCVLG
jgi:hypothetical protein